MALCLRPLIVVSTVNSLFRRFIIVFLVLRLPQSAGCGKSLASLNLLSLYRYRPVRQVPKAESENISGNSLKGGVSSN